MNDIVRAAKILGSCFLVGTGVLGASICMAVPRQYSAGAELFPELVTALGLWLLVGAWTGRFVPGWLQIAAQAFGRFLRMDDSPKPFQTPPSAAPDPTPDKPA